MQETRVFVIVRDEDEDKDERARTLFYLTREEGGLLGKVRSANRDYS
jgi:hypothetical protein